MQKAGADIFTFHIEAMDERNKDVKEMIDKVKAAGMKVGIAIKPKTSVEAVEPYLQFLDLVRDCEPLRCCLLLATASVHRTMRALGGW